MLSWKRTGRDAGVAEWPRRVLEFGVVGVIRFLIVFFSAILLSLGAAAAGDYEDGGPPTSVETSPQPNGSGCR